MNKDKILICIASHKKGVFPKEDIYLPVEVGAELRKEHFLVNLDNQGENISNKNPNYCELTGLYQVYKNYNYDILGLVHYRRYFVNSSFCFKKDLKNVIKTEKIEKLLYKYDIILPKKRHYYIETNYSHYIHSHKKEALDLTREIIKNDYSEYLDYFDKHMKKTSGHYFNMFIAKKQIIKPYLDMMFDILFKLEKMIDLNNYQGEDKRVFGFISELLIDVYCQKNNLRVKNQKYLFMEKQNWFKKIFNFLKRKFNS